MLGRQIYLNPATHLISKYIIKSKYTRCTDIQVNNIYRIRFYIIGIHLELLKYSNMFTSLPKNPKIPNIPYPDTDFECFPFKYLITYLIKYVPDILGVGNISVTPI